MGEPRQVPCDDGTLVVMEAVAAHAANRDGGPMTLVLIFDAAMVEAFRRNRPPR